jgi:hypothetical protein
MVVYPRFNVSMIDIIFIHNLFLNNASRLVFPYESIGLRLPRADSDDITIL